MQIADAILSGIVHINEQTASDEANIPSAASVPLAPGPASAAPRPTIEALTETQWLTVRSTIAPYRF